MNSDEVTMLLARIQVLDNRQVDALTIEAWSPLMVGVDYAAAVVAVNQHFVESTEYLKPAHIVQRIRARSSREALTMSPTISDCGDHRLLADGTCMKCEWRLGDG